MKTITKEYKVYNLEELSKEAQEKAHNTWIEQNDYYFLSDYLNERLYELLKENNIKDTNDTSKPGTKPTQVQYSLSHCQGDGCMFAGDFEWKSYRVNIQHAGRYNHYNSKIINIESIKTDREASEKIHADFDKIYIKICKALERIGYDFIKYEDSFESFQELCEANEYTFLEDGTMQN